MQNRAYIGEFHYSDTVIPDGVPAIVPQELFDRVQMRREKNKRAPAAAKADDKFLLTTKLFCGLCESSMTGVSGTSHKGKKYAYYRCFGKKYGCKQETVPKDLIEETVIQDTLKLLDDKLIDKISQALYDILQEELKNGNVPRLKKLLAANKKATDNLMQLLMEGKAKNTILEKLDQLEKERKKIELQLEVEKSEILDFKLEDLRYYVKRFKHLDYTKTENKQALIDTFVNKVIYYGNKKEKDRYNVTDFSTGSFYERMVEIRGFEPLTYTLRTYRATNCAISPDIGGANRVRTDDLLNAIQTRYQLRHNPEFPNEYYNISKALDCQEFCRFITSIFSFPAASKNKLFNINPYPLILYKKSKP